MTTVKVVRVLHFREIEGAWSLHGQFYSGLGYGIIRAYDTCLPKSRYMVDVWGRQLQPRLSSVHDVMNDGMHAARLPVAAIQFTISPLRDLE